jgi:sec-independent protein translocase protein TatB
MGHPPILVGTISMVDSFILMVMALVVFGPRRLPQIGRQIGKLMYEFRKASNDFKFQMEEELRNAEEADRRKKEEERQRSIAALSAEQASVSADPPPPSVPGESSPYPEPPAGTPSVDAKTDDSAPRIQPPAVGETVARPARTVEPQPEPTNNANPTDTTSLPEGETTNQNPPSASQTAEALNQHG